MRFIVYFFISLFYIVFSQANQVSTDTDKFFVIIIPSYNNAQWYNKNLMSVFSQDYPNYHVIYIDDCSIDETGSLVEDFIKNEHKEDKVTLIKNDTRMGQLANTYYAVSNCDQNQIIVLLDGDDWFADSKVLSYLNAMYTNKNVWLTYGQYQRWPIKTIGHCKKIPQFIIDNNSFRGYEWVTSHLKTFYAGLFQKIKKEDLFYAGEFFRYAADVAYMMPMLEMAGEHTLFISKVLYVYNRANPLNCDKQNKKIQLQMVDIINKKTKYNRLDSLSFGVVL